MWQFLPSYHNYYSLFNRCGQRRPDQWSEYWVFHFNQAEQKTLLAADCGLLHLSVQQSKIKHPECGLRVFVARPHSKGQMLGCYYESLVYSYLGSRRAQHESYGEGMFNITVPEFRTWGNQLSQQMGVERVHHPVYTVLAQLSAISFVNDSRCLLFDKGYATRKEM